jgi:hypothetical protein
MYGLWIAGSLKVAQTHRKQILRDYIWGDGQANLRPET